MKETFSKDRASFANLGEAEIVFQLVLELVTSGVSPKDIGVVTTYNLQVDLLTLNLTEKYPELEIKSVDGFQGREKEVVILSLVRSNQERKLGFLVERRRLNVAVTRARKQLIMVCDSETVTSDQTLTKLVEYVKKTGVQKSAHQFHLDFRMKLPPTIQDKAVKQMMRKKTLPVLNSKSLNDATRGSSDGSSSLNMTDDIAESMDNCNMREETSKQNIGHRFIKEFNSNTKEANRTQQPRGFRGGTMRGGGGHGGEYVKGSRWGGMPGRESGDSCAMGMKYQRGGTSCGFGGYRGGKATSGRIGGMAVMGKYFIVGGTSLCT